MKTIIRMISLMVLFCMTILNAKTQQASDAQYGYIIVPGTYTNGKTYISKIFYFEGEKSCEVWSGNFAEAAKTSFSNYLKTYHSKEYISPENMLAFNFVGTGNFKTRGQAEKHITAQLAEETEAGNKVVFTNFSFSCTNQK